MVGAPHLVQFGRQISRSRPRLGFPWYTALAQNDDCKQALSREFDLSQYSDGRSHWLSGNPVVVAVWRREFPGRGMILGFFTLPLIVPSVVLEPGIAPDRRATRFGRNDACAGDGPPPCHRPFLSSKSWRSGSTQCRLTMLRRR